ncbi:hypothetical protein [Arenicella xantha]|uniref:Uncharacterized protein n=1 Tax=Arenicella xantha TaxID=644221 RepID=A0A395JSC7_9GAMM|nr:hypothetical protein [Arenicella xantha]RBP53366.1 hypothetical protein DFR28_101752 [Arenicella xantha]
MSVPLFKTVRPTSLPQPNRFGETPLNCAPTIRLQNGAMAVPQQFLKVERTLENLENVLAEISLPKDYLLFAGQDSGLLFIVVGVLGVENYPRQGVASNEPKIVYGRRWLIEPSTPTSEIVQTALLAVKKAREHELRELFVVRAVAGAKATPFNCHQDLPLMAGNSDVLKSAKQRLDGPDALKDLLSRVSIDGCQIELSEIAAISSAYVLSIILVSGSPTSHFNDLMGRQITFVCQNLELDHVLHSVFNACLAESDRWLEEHLRFLGFARFSQNLSPIAIAEFSSRTRRVRATNKEFVDEFSDMSYQVDSAKAPRFNLGELGKKQRCVVDSFTGLQGYLPKE